MWSSRKEGFISCFPESWTKSHTSNGKKYSLLLVLKRLGKIQGSQILARNGKKDKPVVATPGPPPEGEHASGNRLEAFGVGLGTNKEGNDGEEEQINTPGRKPPPFTAFHTQFLVNPEIWVCS